MPSGDGNRIWFPEMIEMLRSQWNESTTFPRLVELCAMLDGVLQHHRPIVGPSLPRFSLPEVRQNRQSRRFWPIPHQRSGRHPRAWAVRNCFAGINEEARKGMGPIQDSETAGSVRPSGGGTNCGKRKEWPRLCPLRTALSKANRPLLPKWREHHFKEQS